MTQTPQERALSAVEARRDVIDEGLREAVTVEPPEQLWGAARHLLDAGGKRLRPTMTLLVAEALGEVSGPDVDYRSFTTLPGGAVDVLAAAMAVEVVHTFTLVHDDIIDDDDLRRGEPAVHRAFDVDTAIIAGDTLFAVAFDLLLGAGGDPARTLEAGRLLATSSERICEGQAMDVDFEDRADVTPEEYLDMVERKTAVLYGASAAIPAVLVGADDETVQAMRDFGRDVGRGFQIHDDVLDLTTPSEQLGKQRGSDLLEQKQTLITVHAREQGVDIDDLVAAEDVDAVTEAEIEAAVERLREAGSIEYARETAADLVESGKAELSVLPDNEARRTLEAIADYLVEREY